MMTITKKNIFWVLVFLLVLFVVATWAWKLAVEPKSHQPLSPLAEAPKGGPFTLQSNQGPVSLSDFQGKWVYLYFGYTFCPDICPTNLGHLSAAYHQLTPEEQAHVQVIFVSVDPHRDTPQRLEQYSRYFDMNLIGVTGQPETLATIAAAYGAVYKSHQKNNDDAYYSVDHSAFTYVINPKGELVGQLPHGTDAELFLKNIRHHLRTENRD